MGRFLGIDYGEKRIGLSYGDELGIATPLPAAVATRKQERLQQIETLIGDRQVEALVVGYPFNMDGSIGFKAKEVDQFISELEKRFRLPVHRVDERLTTRQAESGLRALGKNSKDLRQDRHTGDVDSRAAAIILQDFLDACNPQPLFPNYDEDEEAAWDMRH